MKGIESGIIITDIRNFTGTFNYFQKNKNSKFMDIFINDFYDIHIKIAESICDDFWYNSLGDSMIFIFFGKNHHKNAYAFSISLHRYLTKLCEIFNQEHGTKVSFGIGCDTGEVWKMKIKNRNSEDHITYLGNTINCVKRIESQTKSFAETELIIGGNMYDDLMKDLYTEEYADARLFKTNYGEILKSKPSLVLMSEKILLYYIFKLNLPGVEKPLPLFRYDNDLALREDFYNVLSLLVEKRAKLKIMALLRRIIKN